MKNCIIEKVLKNVLQITIGKNATTPLYSKTSKPENLGIKYYKKM